MLLDFPETLTDIGFQAFSKCSSLTSISLPAGVTYIGEAAFDECEALVDVSFGGTEELRNERRGNGWVIRGNDHLFNATWSYHYDGCVEHVPDGPVREKEVAATCTDSGSYDEVVYCSVCGEELSRNTVTVPALGHQFELIGWLWNEYEEATATFICKNDSSHVEKVSATITSERTEPTVGKQGSVVYTAAVEFEGQTYTDAKTEVLPALKPGWQEIDGKWYYFNADGTPKTGWLKSGSSWFYLDPNTGVMATGWVKVGGTWYYMKDSGAMATGWQKIGSTWYYFESSGAMKTGWLKSGSTWYYLKSSGAMAVGWQKVGSTWYYFQSSGAMKTGWLKDGGKWYYLDSSGAMLASTSRNIGGKVYYFNASGVCTNP